MISTGSISSAQIRMRQNSRLAVRMVRMSSGAMIAVAMTLNELCANTTKFGALSVPAGRVEITWTLDPETLDQKPQRLHLTWTERDGPAVQPPESAASGPG